MASTSSARQQALEVRVRPAGAELGLVDRLAERVAVGGGRAVDAGDLGVADRLEALGVEVGDEARADEADTQGGRRFA